MVARSGWSGWLVCCRGQGVPRAQQPDGALHVPLLRVSLDAPPRHHFSLANTLQSAGMPFCLMFRSPQGVWRPEAPELKASI